MNWLLRAAYVQSMRGLQTAALELYRAHRLQPSEEGINRLQTVAALLREVTHRAHQFVAYPLVSIMQCDSDGTIIRQSLAGE